MLVPAVWINVNARWSLSVCPTEADTLHNIISDYSDTRADTALPNRGRDRRPTGDDHTKSTGGRSHDDCCHPECSPCTPHLERRRGQLR